MSQKRSSYLSGLVEMFISFLVPIPLVVTFLLGLPSEKMSHALTFSLGIFAYVWMLMTLYVSVKPQWLSQFINHRLAYLNQAFLMVLALIASFFHQSINISTGVGQFIAFVTFAVLVAFSLYSFVYYFAKPFLEKNGNTSLRTLKTILTSLNSLGIIMVLLHVHLISYVRANVLFMILCDGLSLPILAYIVYKWVKSSVKAVEKIS